MPAPACLDWLGCATFRLTRGDLVVFLDAYMDRVPSAPATGMDTTKVDRANWIVVGHSHFDHLWGAVLHQDRLARLSSRGQQRESLGQDVRERPRVILGHHDDWLPGVSTAVDTAPIRAAMAQTCPTAELSEMGYCAGVDVFA
jgi:hypothetical protein